MTSRIALVVVFSASEMIPSIPLSRMSDAMVSLSLVGMYLYLAVLFDSSSYRSSSFAYMTIMRFFSMIHFLYNILYIVYRNTLSNIEKNVENIYV